MSAPPAIALTAAIYRDPDNDVARALRARGYEVRCHTSAVMPDPATVAEMLRGAVGIIAGSEPLTRELLSGAPDLRVISRNGVGYDAIDLDAATDLGIVVTYIPDAMVDAVADLAFGLLLACARRIPELSAGMRRGEWPRLMGADVTGRTLGIIGTGRIGMAVARRARGFRMRLVGADPTPNPLFVEEVGGDYLPLDELLEVADFVTLHLPSLASTRGILAENELGRMKPGSILVNTARGALIDEAALLRNLDSGRIAMAGLDVLVEEPPTPGSDSDRLARHPSVVPVPHIGAFTPKTIDRMAAIALENLVSVLEGRRPQHVINPAVYERSVRTPAPLPR